jgi:phosphoglycerate dehydrogenase-like enzyme
VSASSETPTVLLPYPEEELTGLPSGLDTAVWDGTGAAPQANHLGQVEVLVIPYPHNQEAIPLLPQMPRLRVVQALTAGVDDIVPHLPDGVTLCSASGVHSTSTAELALTLILASQRGIPEFVRNQESGAWKPGWRQSLADRTVLIVGYGSIGQAVEARLAPFECEVLRVAHTPRETPRGKVHATSDLPDLLPRADVTVLTLPLTKGTQGLMNADLLAKMKDGALLVNVARGPIVDTDALLAELRGGRLRAALDVTDPEPLPADHPLWHAPGVLVSPHVGGVSSAFEPRAKRLIAEQVSRFSSGKELLNVVVSGR